MANNPFEAFTRVFERIIKSNDYIEISDGDTDKMVIAILKMKQLAEPGCRIVIKENFTPTITTYRVEWNPPDNMAYGQKWTWDWMHHDWAESQVELNMDEVEVKHDDSETEIKNLQADSLHYYGVCSHLVDGRRIYRNGYIPIVPCGSGNR